MCVFLVVLYVICLWYLFLFVVVFINFLSLYQIFFSVIMGILICDYYFFRCGCFDIFMFYLGYKDFIYYFFYGFNLRVFVVYLIVIVFNFYGFFYQMGVYVLLGIQRFYYVVYFVGFFLVFGSFWLMNIFFLMKNIFKFLGWQEFKDFVEVYDGIFVNVVIDLFDIVFGDQEMGNVEKFVMEKY